MPSSPSPSSVWTTVLRSSFRRGPPGASLLLPVLCRSFMTRRSLAPRYQTVSLHRLSSSTATAPSPQNAAEAAPVEDEVALFSSLEGKVHKNTLRALTTSPFQYNTMSVVQAEILPTLPHLISPREDGHANARDLLVKARTGTGKTIAFLVPAVEARVKELERIASSPSSATAASARRASDSAQEQYARDNIGTLVISPTRELASQIAVEAQKLTSHHRGFQTSLFVGGLDRHAQLSRFRNARKDILVATPGRLKDFLQDSRSGVADALKNTKLLILDEADTLLDMGFRSDIESIMEYLPSTDSRQTMLFSATVSEGIQQIANTHLARNHLFVNCVSQDTSPVHEHIPQYHTVLPSAKDQFPHIMRLIFQDQLEHGNKSKVVLFLSTTKMTELSAGFLKDVGRVMFPATATDVFELHSKLSMNGRMRAAQWFRSTSKASVLVTSDVSARGVDYPGVTRVIQVGLPKSAEQYVHRVGRTGRGGSLIGRGDLVLLPWELEFVRRNFSHLPLKPLSVKDFEEQGQKLVTEGGEPKAMARYMDIERNVTEALSRVDTRAVEESMMSMIGFYAALASAGLRLDVSGIVDSLQKWAKEGMGLAQAPYVSAQFISKLGGGGGASARRATSFGANREWRSDRSAKPWESRGEGERRPWVNRGEGERKPWESRGDGERRPWVNRGEGERKPWESRGEGERRPARGDGEHKPWEHRGDGERKPWAKREHMGRRTRSFEARMGSE